jgi:hypothetical protein
MYEIVIKFYISNDSFKYYYRLYIYDIDKGGLATNFLLFAITTATSKICSQLQLLLLLKKSSSLLTTATA